MLSKADDWEALERLERASRTRDADAQRILLQDVVRQGWRMTELKKSSVPTNANAYEELARLREVNRR